MVEPTYYYWLKKIRKLTIDSIGDGPDIVDITPVVTHTVKNESCASNDKFLKMHKGDLTVEIPFECPEWVLEKVTEYDIIMVVDRGALMSENLVNEYKELYSQTKELMASLAKKSMNWRSRIAV